MKPSLPVLFVFLLALQAFQVDSSRSRLDALFAEHAPKDMPHQRAIQVLFNLPTIVTGFLEYQDTQQSLVQLYQYFLNARAFENLLHDFFRFMDKDRNAIVTQEEYQSTMIQASIDREAADRVYVLAALDNPSRELGFGDFKIAMELFFVESISPVTFAYILGGPEHSQDVGVEHEDLVRGMQQIFEKLGDEYPLPGCDQLEYLFKQFDRDGDNLLNPEEFYHVVAIFLRYYKSGLENFKYSKLIHRDDIFLLLWQKENIEITRVARKASLVEATSDFFQLAVFEKILNSVGHDIFLVVDENKNGVLELDEFKVLLSFFGSPESEALLLYTTADTDGSGSIDYGEFLVVFETYVRRALSSLAFNLAKVNGHEIDVHYCNELWRNITGQFNINIGLTDEAFENLYNLLDVDHNGILDATEFGEFASTVITSIKKRLREDIDTKISVMSGVNATRQAISQAYQETLSTAKLNQELGVAQGIVARIISKSSVSMFKTTYTETVETTTTTSASLSTKLPSESSFIAKSNDEFDYFGLESFGFIDSGIALGARGYGFGLYDVVSQSIQSMQKEDLPEGSITNMGVSGETGILLQSHLKGLGKLAN